MALVQSGAGQQIMDQLREVAETFPAATGDPAANSVGGRGQPAPPLFLGRLAGSAGAHLHFGHA